MIGKFLFLDGSDLELDEAGRSFAAPVRFRQSPVITNRLHHCANFSNTVIRGEAGRWQAWYVATDDPAYIRRYTAYSTSSNGATWTPPIKLAGTDGREFSDLLDTGRPALTWGLIEERRLGWNLRALRAAGCIRIGWPLRGNYGLN